MTAAAAAALAPANAPCAPAALAVLKEAFEAFVSDPLATATRDRLQHAVEELSPADPHFFGELMATRQRQLEKHGGFKERFVLSKDVGPDGTLRALPRSIPVRDDTRNKLARLVRDNPSRFPGGIQQLLDAERPLQQASCANYAKLIAATVLVELDSLLKCNRHKLLKSSATVLDLADAYRHLQRIAGAHPKVVETIDQNDTTAIIEFLVTLGSRTPLTEAELTRFVSLAADGWQQAGEKDLIVRGRVVQSGLDGKAALLTTWVAPFAAVVIDRGLLAKLQAAFRKRLAASVDAAPPARPAAPAASKPAAAPPATSGTFSAPFKPLAPAAPASLSDTGPLAVSSTDAFKVPIGVPEPVRLQVLRNYLKVSSTATVIRLSEAMRMCEAKDDVVGHRQYVQRVFHEEGWAIIGQTRGDPMFSRLSSATTG